MSIFLDGDSLKALPLRSRQRNKIRMPILTIPIHHTIGSPSQNSQARK